MNKIYDISIHQHTAQNILQYLNKKGYYLQLEKRGLNWNLYPPRNKNRKPILKIPKNLIETIAQFKWIKISTGQAIITKNGKNALENNDPKINAITLKTIREKNTTRSVTVNQNDNIIENLARRYDKEGKPLISQQQMHAAIILQKNYENAQGTQKITLNWETLQNNIKSKNTQTIKYINPQHAIDAKIRLKKTLDYLGPELTPIIIEICCKQCGLEQTEKNLRIPKRSARIILQIALTRLARYYGLEPEKKKIPIQHWGKENYRPKINL